MTELFRTRCQQGTLIITDTTITIKLASIRSDSLLRSSLSSIDSKQWMPSIFLGGATNLTFIGKGGESLRATFIKTSVAKDIVSALKQ